MLRSTAEGRNCKGSSRISKCFSKKRKVKSYCNKMPYRDLQFRLETQRFNDEFLETITSLEQVRIEIDSHLFFLT